MKKIKALVVLALATTIVIASSINVFANVDGFVAKDQITKELYQYYEADFMENFKKQNESEAFFYEFLSVLNNNSIYLIHDDSGKYISYEKALKEFEVKEANGETFDINKYCEKAEAVPIPEYVYNRKLRDNRVINELNLIKDNTNKDFKQDKFMDFEGLRLTGNNITISNGEIKGTLTVDPGKNGTSFVNNIKAKNIKILSGSENSIHFFNVNADTLEVNSDDKTRVEIKGETKIGNTTIRTYAILDSVSGTYGEIRIAINEKNKSEKQQIVELRGKFTEPIIVESSVTLKVHENAIVPKVEISPKNKKSEIKLYGKFKDVVVKKECELTLGENTTVNHLKSDAVIDLKGDKTASIFKLEAPKNVNKGNVKVSQIMNTNEENNNVYVKPEDTSSKSEEKPSKSEEKPSKVDNQEDKLAVVDIEKSRIMETEYVYYGIIVLKQGTVNDYEFFVDDKKVEVEKVNTKGTILKIELSDLEDKGLIVKKGNAEERITLKGIR